jgi:hypothetical protein
MLPILARRWNSYSQLRAEATALAGGLTDLPQRASVYHHLYKHSNGNHVFPLLAAHGALWAKGYFQMGMKLGWALSWRYIKANERKDKLHQLVEFANAFRDINRRVCVETFTIYYLCRQPDLLHFSEHHMPNSLIDKMIKCNAATDKSEYLSNDAKRELFGEFFLWEQHNIVGPAVDAAVKAFEWPQLKKVALRPALRFSYLPWLRPLRFDDFASMPERVERGFQAYDAASLAGWANVERALRKYRIMPGPFFTNSETYFEKVCRSVGVPSLGTSQLSA